MNVNVHPGSAALVSAALGAQVGRAACSASEACICQTIVCATQTMSLGRSAPRLPSAKVVHASRVRARRFICRDSRDLNDEVPIICDGWAALVCGLSDGSRQILSILLPGDMVSTTLLFNAEAVYTVEAITEVRYRTFTRADLRARLFEDGEVFAKFSKAWVDESIRADELIIDLGRRTAEGRIVRLILDLWERLAQRGLVDPQTRKMDFPLRQHHIADATGLSPVHVSKVFSKLRDSGVFRMDDRSLTILKPEELRHIAPMRA